MFFMYSQSSSASEADFDFDFVLELRRRRDLQFRYHMFFYSLLTTLKGKDVEAIFALPYSSE